MLRIYVNPLMLNCTSSICRLDPMVFWTITLELTIISENISRRVIGNVLINILQSIVSLIMLLPAIFHQNCLAAFGCCGH